MPGGFAAKRHFGPAGNPMRPVDAGPAYDSPRHLERVSPEARSPVHAIGAIAETNYVALKPGDDAEMDGRLMQRVGEMKAYSYQSTDHGLAKFQA